MFRKFVFVALLFVTSSCFAQLSQSGIIALIGYSEQELVFITDDINPTTTSISLLHETATVVRLFDETLFVLNGDDFLTGEGSGFWFAERTEIQTAVNENRDVDWNVIDLPDDTNPYDILKVDSLLFISYQQANSVVVLDMENGFEIVETFNGISYPQGLAYNGQFVAVAESGLGNGNRIFLIDPVSLDTPTAVDVSVNPQWLDVDREGNFHTICTGNYVDVFGSAWKLDTTSDPVTTSSLDLDGTPSSIKIVQNSFGEDIVFTGDEYAFSTPNFYAYKCADMSVEDSGLSGQSGGWCLTGNRNKLYIGSTMNNTLYHYSLDGFAQPTMMATLQKEVVSIQFWQGETSGVDQGGLASILPKTPQLLSIWPNPFNSTTTVKIKLNSTSGAELLIYNMLGQKVQSYDLDSYSTGIHQIAINGEDLTSGTYFLTVQSHSGNVSRKITLVK